MRHLIPMILTLVVSTFSATSAGLAADFRLETYFSGHTRATGHFTAITGVKRAFTVDLTGRWKGHVLTLREDFVFDDGERDRKTWRFIKTREGRYTGTRDDVVGTTHVIVTGNNARFTYLVDLDPGPKTDIVRFHDSMTLQPDNTVINSAWVTKYGFPVARTDVNFSKSR